MSKTIKELDKAKGSRPSGKTEGAQKAGGPDPDIKTYGTGRIVSGSSARPAVHFHVSLLALIGIISGLSFVMSLKSFFHVREAAALADQYRYKETWEIDEYKKQIADLQRLVKNLKFQNENSLKTMETSVAETRRALKEAEDGISKLTVSNNALRAYINDLNRITSSEINKLKNQK